jgi:AhpC/TSA family.
MKKHYLLLFLICVFIIGSLSAQKSKSTPKQGHEITFNIKNSKDKLMYLVIHYNEKLILKDSTTPVAPGKFVFKGTKKYDDGMYSLVSGEKKLYLNFIIDNNQFFTYNLDTTGNVENFSVQNSPENVEMLKFQRKTADAQKRATAWGKKVKDFEGAGKTDSAEVYKEKLKNLNTEMQDFINELIAAHPDYLFSKMQKSYQEVEVPTITKDDGSVDKEAQVYYYRRHFWDNFDLGDHRFIYIPSFEPKMKDYFTKILYYQASDTINQYIDLFLEKTEKDTFMYHYCVSWLTYEFETSKIIGHDAVFYHIAKNNQLAGKCYWLDDDLLAKYEKRIKRIEPILIGKIAPELIIPDTNLYEDAHLWKSSYHTTKPYTILWFYDPNCPTCKKESKKLYHVYDSLETAGTRNFDVYAIGNDDTIEAWKKYVKDNKYPWTQVGGNKGNIDYLDHFGIYETGNPAMFIIDNSDHRIILNKRIDMNNLPQFLEEYEKIELKKNKQ